MASFVGLQSDLLLNEKRQTFARGLLRTNIHHVHLYILNRSMMEFCPRDKEIFFKYIMTIVQINETVLSAHYLATFGTSSQTSQLLLCRPHAPRARERKFNSHSGVLLKIMSRGSELPWREYCDHYNSALSSWLLEAQIRPLLTGSLPGATIFRLPFTSKILVSALAKSPQKPAVSCHAGWRRRLMFFR
jgi:hypothetical protein